MSCSNLKPSVCGGTMNPQIPDGNNCNTSVRIVGANNVSIKQGNEIDLRSGVKAYDGNGNEISYTVSPTSIEKCDVGVHKITYTAEGEGADSLPHLSCGGNRVFAKACNTVRRVVERLVTVVKANNPVINGLSKVTLPVGGSLSPLSGVTAYDDNGNQLSVSYSGKKANVASGEIASFDDSTGEDALSLEVTLSPIQDLHGYDAPWVGGAGKQILPNRPSDSYGGITYTRNDDGSVTVNGTATALSAYNLFQTSIIANLTAGETYHMRLVGYEGTDIRMQVYSNGTWVAEGFGTDKTFTIPTDSTTNYVRLRVGQGTTIDNVTVYPMVSKTEITEYEPYENICPISGYDEVSANVCGVNVWDEEWENGSLNSSGEPISNRQRIRSKNYIPVVSGRSYYCKSNYGTSGSIWCEAFDSNKTLLSDAFDGTYYKNINNSQFTIPSKAKYIRFVVVDSEYNNDISINYPPTDTEYHAYLGSTYTTTLPQTVYGGTLDMVSGECVVDRAMVDLGTLDWRVSYPELSEGHAYRALFQQMAINPNLLVPSEYAYKRNGSTTVIASNIKDGECWAQNSASWVWIRDDRYYTAEDFKTAMSGVQLVYPLATPQTYQLTPQQINTLLGQNNVWSDGDSVEIKYMATINQSGDIEYPVEGTFSLNYTATDECGNTTTKIRTVYVGEFTYRTVLYSDGTFIVNEASTDMEDNIAEHGEAVGVYEPYKTPNDYIFNGATQRPWHAFSQNVTRVEIGSPIKPVFMSYWFSYFANATSFDLTKLDTEDTVYMNYTFYRCSSVKELDLSNFETSKVVNYNNMFGEDYSLEAIYASDSFVITGTPSSSNMFEQCNSIIGGSGTAYDANHIDAEYARFDNAPTTPGYFRNVNTTYRTVIYVDKTMIINESSEDTLNNIAKHGSATNVYEPMNADGSNYVFYYNGPNSRPWDAQASQVRRVEVGSPIKPTDTSFWFHLFTNCTDIDMTNMDTSLADKMYYMFAYCHSLENITYGGFSTANATDIGGMFVDCRSLSQIQAWRMDTSKVQYAPSVFHGCSALTDLDVTTWDTSDMVVMDAMFKGMTLETIDLSSFDTSSVESMKGMFENSSFEVLDLSSFDTSSITYVLNQRGGIASMFAGCSQLETIYASNKFDVTHLPQGSEGRRDTFDGCVALVGGAGTTYSETWGEYARIDNPPSLPGYFTGKGTTYRTVIYSDKTLIINEASTDIEANTASHGNAEYTYEPMSEANPYVFEDAQDRPWSGLAGYVEHVEFGSVVQPTSTAYWFFGSAALEDFDPTNLDTSNTTKMNYMFYNCAGFESFFLNIDTSKVTDMSNMFNSCIRLKTLDLSSFDTRSLTSMRNMFNACYVLETIYATDKFDVTNVNEEWVFVSNDHLVGGGGTAYASGYHSSEYARIDNPPTAKGYFTAK